ncbi:MAG: M23 family metallopeptidase [Treponema sp.]|jgi:murein DD-endopeptidase MepM/ murein hydrolase activator NlpD|nr:M23 family metallopeptidase [Treponema sp.]
MKKLWLFSWVLFTLFIQMQCAGQSAPDIASVESAAAAFGESAAAAGVSLASAAQRTTFAVVPDTVRPGDPFAVAVTAPAGVRSRWTAQLFGTAGNRIGQAVFFDLREESSNGPVWAALMAVPSTAAPGRAMVRIIGENGAVLGEPAVVIESREFRTENLPLTNTMSDILTVPDPQKTLESRRLAEILNHTGSEVFCTGGFVMPVVSQVQTSRFGNRRVYRYPDGRTSSSIHAGIDWRAPEGTPITVCAPGRVVFAGPRIVTGNTVIIEHMPGVYSLCYHLSRIDLAEGRMVTSGESLGLAGSTGFSTASHLHWEVRVAGENTDPEAFLGRTILDKDAIMSKLNE